MNTEYSKMKSREAISKAYIEKLEKLKIEDLSIVAALSDFVETGNKNMFDEYIKFHFIISAEEREVRYDKAQQKAKLLAKAQERHEKYQAEFKEWKTKYYQWRDEQLKLLNDGIEHKDYINIAGLNNFIEGLKDKGKKNFAQSSLYVRIDNEIKHIASVSLADDMKVVFDVDNNKNIFVADAPESPRLTIDERLMFENNPY